MSLLGDILLRGKPFAFYYLQPLVLGHLMSNVVSYLGLENIDARFENGVERLVEKLEVLVGTSEKCEC